MADKSLKLFVIAGGLNMLLSVAIGAFGAHVIKSKLSAEMMEVYQTGVHYHMAHALGLLLVAVLSVHIKSRLINWSGWLIVTGIVLFSGSLYVLSITGVRSFGAITPLGGVAFLSGWLVLIFAALKK